MTAERGVDVILDMVAGDYVARELKCLADDGRLAIIAVQGGTKSEIDSGAVLRKRLTITGSTLRPRSVAFKGQHRARAARAVWPLIEAGRIKPVIHQRFPAAQAAAAHALMESSTHVGKIVLELELKRMTTQSKLIVGNWKMHGSHPANAELLAGIVGGRPYAGRRGGVRAVPLPVARRRSRWRAATSAGARRTVSAHEQGAYTGEVSAAMLHEFGCRYAIVGHSERRAVPRRERSARRRQGQGRAGARRHAHRVRRRDAGRSARPARPTRSSSASCRR